MEWKHIILYCLLLVSCTKKADTNLKIFSDQFINQWETNTTDSIISIINHNKDTKANLTELKSLYFYYDRPYNHSARIVFIDQIRNDTAVTNLKFKEFAVIEEKRESRMIYRLFLFGNSNSICLLYKNKPGERAFMFLKKYEINSHELKLFLKKAKNHKSIASDGVNGEYLNGDVVISVFSNGKIEVYPFLTNNLTNSLYREYVKIMNNNGK